MLRLKSIPYVPYTSPLGQLLFTSFRCARLCTGGMRPPHARQAGALLQRMTRMLQPQVSAPCVPRGALAVRMCVWRRSATSGWAASCRAGMALALIGAQQQRSHMHPGVPAPHGNLHTCYGNGVLTMHVALGGHHGPVAGGSSTGAAAHAYI